MVRVIRFILVGLLIAGVTTVAYADGGPKAGKGTPPKKSEGALFVDVPPDHWASDDLKYLAERGIITGLPDGKFQGDKFLTRYSAVSLIARAVRFVQNNPDLVTAKDLQVIQELIFKISDKLQQMQEELNQMRAKGEGSELIAAIQEQTQQNEQRISELERQLKSFQIASSTDLEAEFKRLQRQANASFIIAIAGLFVGIIGIALATMG